MCGRFTRNYTWQQLHALYRLTAPAAIPNFQPNDYLQRWAVSKRVNSAKADKDDATLIEPIERAA
jgi:hypothetical protein